PPITPTAIPPGVSETVRRAQEALNAAGYAVGVPDGHAGTQTIAAVRRFQTDKSLPVTGSLDQITLDALGVANDSAGLSPAVGATSSIILTDAVNALAHTADPQTGKPGLLAATNSGLYRSYDPTKGWQKLPYGAAFDSHTTTVSTDAKQPETIWVGTASSGVLV